MGFKDHFSRQATDYAKFRPRYPREMFDYLGTLTPARQLAELQGGSLEYAPRPAGGSIFVLRLPAGDVTL